MILTTDVHYTNNAAVAAGIVFPEWKSDTIQREIVKTIPQVAPYEPGAFYKRELPCIKVLLAAIDIDLECIIVDGFVTLGEDATPGLGLRLYEMLAEKTPVIGVAKSMFDGTPQACQLLRGNSTNPLYITAAGMPLALAKSRIAVMHGAFRIPTLLKRVDRLCREPQT